MEDSIVLDTRRHQEFNERFEIRLNQQTKEHDRLQGDYRILTEEIQQKQRILHELQTKSQQHLQLERDIELTREEYYQLKDELDQFAYTLRFSIEEELKIYEALLNSVERKLIVQSNDYRPLKNQMMKTTESNSYEIAQSMLGLNEIQCSLNAKRSVEWEEKYLQRRFRITRRYLGKMSNEIHSESID